MFPCLQRASWETYSTVYYESWTNLKKLRQIHFSKSPRMHWYFISQQPGKFLFAQHTETHSANNVLQNYYNLVGIHPTPYIHHANHFTGRIVHALQYCCKIPSQIIAYNYFIFPHSINIWNRICCSAVLHVIPICR